MGTGLLAVYCDLDPEWIADFRPWLAEDMFPAREAIGFGPAASFDLIPQRSPSATAQNYVTFYVAPSLGDLYGVAYQGLRAHRGERDAAYHQQMKNHARYTAGWVGPGIEGAGGDFAPVLFVDRFDLQPADVQAFNMWYETDYLPSCAGLPGLNRLRRYLSMEGQHRHILIHEFDEESALGTEAWRGLRSAEPMSLCTYAEGAPAAYRRVISSS